MTTLSTSARQGKSKKTKPSTPTPAETPPETPCIDSDPRQRPLYLCGHGGVSTPITFKQLHHALWDVMSVLDGLRDLIKGIEEGANQCDIIGPLIISRVTVEYIHNCISAVSADEVLPEVAHEA